jgi:hypothetical protein
MNGAVSGLIETMINAYGAADGWETIPYGGTSWWRYGGAGIDCWGTLCGVPNGCCAFLNVIGLQSMASAVLHHYSETEFPTTAVCDCYDDNSSDTRWTTGSAFIPKPDDGSEVDPNVLAHTTAHSPLCHISISKWCYAAGVHLGSADAQSRGHKQDRCGKICADMAAFTAELINGASSSVVLPDVTKFCTSCHWKSGKDPAVYPAQCGQMECGECHTAGTYMTVAPRLQMVDVWASDPDATDPYAKVDTFNVGDNIRYNVAFSVMTGATAVNIKVIRQSWVKDSVGTKLAALREKQALPKGTHQYHWDDDLIGAATGQAKIKVRMQMGSRDPITKLAYFNVQ